MKLLLATVIGATFMFYAVETSGQQSQDGTIHIIYDYSRTGAREILMATFTEDDVISGNQESSTVSLRMVVSKFPEIETTRADDFSCPTDHLWKPVPDNIYLQELGQKIPLDRPVNSDKSKSVTFKIGKSHLSFYDINSKSWIAEPEEFEVMIGNSSRGIRLKDSFTVIKY